MASSTCDEDNLYDMSLEINRIISFKNWPSSAPNFTIELAKCGFFYYGDSDEVKCYFCGCILRGWLTNDIPSEAHIRESPDCLVAQKIKAEEVTAITEYSTGVKYPLGTNNNEETSYNSLEVFPSQSRTLDSSAIYTSPVPSEGLSGISYTSRTVSSSSDESRLEELNTMLFEAKRLDTFRNWNPGNPVSAARLARAGFFHLPGTKDTVQCAFCHGILKEWEAGDDVDQQHTFHFPRCPFILGREVNNTPIYHSEAVQRQFKEPTSALMQPKVPQYADQIARVQSFINWPPSPQDIHTLSQAGFYYTGLNDQVKCFFCEGGLRNWEASDDPWTEHACWFPECLFVRRVKGDAFVAKARKRQIINAADDSSVQPSRDENTSSSPLAELNQRVKNCQHSDQVRNILAMGYDSKLVKRALELRLLNSTANTCPSAELLLEQIFIIEEHMSHNGGAMPELPLIQPPSAPSDLLTVESSVSPTALSRQMHSFSFENAPSNSPVTATRRESSPEMPQDPTPASPTSSQDSSAPLSTKKKRKRRKHRSRGIESSAISEPSASDKVNYNENPPTFNTQTEAGNMVSDKELPSLELTQSLMEENRQLKDQRLCKICLDEEISVVFLPCGHLVSCPTCAPALRNCPMCRKLIRGTVKTFIS